MTRSRNRLGAALAVTALLGSILAYGANHREAPLTALDQKADITDFFAFRSYADSSKVTLILCVDPFLEPSNGPNYFPFDPDILYAIRVDNNNDAVEDVVFEVRFKTEIRAPGVFTGFVGAGDSGVVAPANSPAPVAPGTLIVPPAITALDGPGSAGLSLRQTYTVTMVKGRSRKMLGTFIAVPSNVGPRTMPDYNSLVEQGTYDAGNGISVFAGTVDDPFWIDLGGAFDTLNFRPSAFDSGIPGVLGAAQDTNDDVNFAADDVSGFNVNAIAIEVPIAMLTFSGAVEPATSTAATIGTWGTTSRPRVTIMRSPQPAQTAGGFLQVQRMGNPLINELLIGTGSKDLFSRSQPKDDSQFANFFLDPLLARVLNALYAGAVAIPEPPRTDLLPLVTYAPPIAAAGTPAGPVADLLRLNTGVAATPIASQSRLGLLAGDGAGFPNGRRPGDDVTDIAARAVAGVLTGDPAFSGFPNNSIGDGVNTNDVPYSSVFPYMGIAHSGRNSRHVDPTETGCTGVCPQN